MRIVVNHLTRMRGGHVCVAGVDVRTDRHVRPVLRWGSLTPALLARNHGPFDMANVVDLGTVEPCPKPPHVEDHWFSPPKAELLERLGAEEFWALLYAVSKPRLRDVFGDELRPMGRSSCGTPVGQGRASLGCFRPNRRQSSPWVEKGRDGALRVRIRIDDGELHRSVAVTDLRLYGKDHATADPAAVRKLADRLRSPGAVILGVGLTRAFSSSSEQQEKPVHWLQVNNVHLEDDPTWPLG
ncbi:MAG TPA: hypothetical protein VMY37_35100 [Thermoguttaceae bacterium]|nr:hypothetical protein [Thermoguttaceae bacterium]